MFEGLKRIFGKRAPRQPSSAQALTHEEYALREKAVIDAMVDALVPLTETNPRLTPLLELKDKYNSFLLESAYRGYTLSLAELELRQLDPTQYPPQQYHDIMTGLRMMQQHASHLNGIDGNAVGGAQQSMEAVQYFSTLANLFPAPVITTVIPGPTSELGGAVTFSKEPVRSIGEMFAMPKVAPPPNGDEIIQSAAEVEATIAARPAAEEAGQDAITMADREGYARGWKEGGIIGRRDGYRLGHEEGTTEGHERGHQLGHEEGVEQGHQEERTIWLQQIEGEREKILEEARQLIATERETILGEARQQIETERETILEQGRQLGILEGHKQGHSEGLTEGHQLGLDDGLTEGHQLGREEIIRDGIRSDQVLRETHALGLKDGVDIGYQHNREDAHADGVKEGKRIGREEGIEMGRKKASQENHDVAQTQAYNLGYRDAVLPALAKGAVGTLAATGLLYAYNATHPKIPPEPKPTPIVRNVGVNRAEEILAKGKTGTYSGVTSEGRPYTLSIDPSSRYTRPNKPIER